MLPTLRPDQRLLVNRICLCWRSPRRGELVLFRVPVQPAQIAIKRVVGLPGEQVSLWEGALSVDGQLVPEPYVANPDCVGGFAWRLGPREYFLLGDNRRESTDSRDFGPVPARLLLGIAWYRYWPTEQRGILARK
jgi:signal peptidase I